MQHYRRVSVKQRCQIEALLGSKIPVSSIAALTGLHRSTIYRERNRNRHQWEQTYDAASAHEMAAERFKNCRRQRIFACAQKVAWLKALLKAGLSPEQIFGRYRVASHQTIYNEVWNHVPHLARYFRRYGRRRGRGRKGRRVHRAKPAWHRPISQRPASVDRREELGHWERDTMFVKDRNMILVCIERKSRFVRLEKLKSVRCFADVAEQSRRMMTVGSQKPLSVTNDNGSEFLDGARLDFPVFYCEPYSPQQRGSVENIIGLLRAHFTRQTDIATVTQHQLKRVEDQFNNRPRKCLGYRTPSEVLLKTGVALAF